MYRPGKTNIANALSHLNSVKQLDRGKEYDFIRAVVESCVPVALSPKEVEEASYNDEELCLVKNCVKSGNWEQSTIPSYAHVKDKSCTYGKLLLRGTRIVVPKVLRDKVVRLAHEGHQGVVKTKYRLRSKVRWPGMDKDVENLCKVCHGCQVTSSCDPPDPMSRVLPPSAPWQDCSADLLGPLPTGESVLVVVDYYSRFLEVALLKSITSTKIIEAITHMFARFGVPFSLRTDNGPQFVSEEFEAFLRAHGVEHRRTTPLWPQANGEVERQNHSLLKSLQIANLEGKYWRTELVTWLTAYRSTPQATTGATPFYLMFGWEMRTKLPELRRETIEVLREEVRDRDWSNKLKGKAYADARRGATRKSIWIGDTVLLKAEKSNKLSANFRPSPFKVVQRTGTEVTVRNEAGEEFRRNAVFIKKYYEQDDVARANRKENSSSEEIGRSQEVVPPTGMSGNSPEPLQNSPEKGEETESQMQTASPVISQQAVRRSSRIVKKPVRFGDFVLSLRN